MEEYIVEIKKIIGEINEYETFDEETNLIEEGILSSLSLMYLISELEERYDIFIEEKLVTPENFSTVEKIAMVIETLV